MGEIRSLDIRSQVFRFGSVSISDIFPHYLFSSLNVYVRHDKSAAHPAKIREPADYRDKEPSQ